MVISMIWWHISDFEFTVIVESASIDNIPEYSDGNVYGPFDTFGDAKRDAIEYHRATLENAKRCISEIKMIKKKDIKETEVLIESEKKG